MNLFKTGTITFIFFIILSSICFGENVLMEMNSLNIYIRNKEYEGKKFLNEDGMLYTSLEDLAMSLKVDYEFLTEDGKDKLYVLNGEEKSEYLYSFIKKDEKLYVPLTTFSQVAGYRLNYDEQENILDVFKEEIPFKMEGEDKDLDFDYGKLIISTGDKKYDGVEVIIRSLDDRYLNITGVIRYFYPLILYVSPGKYKLTVRETETKTVLREEKIEVMKDLEASIELK